MDDKFVLPEDYVEPNCPLNMNKDNKIKRIPVMRVIEKLDSHLAKNDYDAAERHLLYWMEEAEQGYDEQGLLTVYNELMGLYRKQGKKEKALDFAQKAIVLVEKAELLGTFTAGTTYLNSATVYKAFGLTDLSIDLFERAKTTYEKVLPQGDSRFGGLYNNMALALVDAKRYDEAEQLYLKALDIMGKEDGGGLEQAITYLNMATMVEVRFPREKGDLLIKEYVEKAMTFIEDYPLEKGGYYAFVCEKCATSFGYYCFPEYAKELSARARRIYEGS